MQLRVFFCLALTSFAASLIAAGTTPRSVEVGGLTRTYQLHVPDSLSREPEAEHARIITGKGTAFTMRTSHRPAPLVIVFHGSGANGSSMERFSKFSELADREGFIVAYPDAMKHEWNDGREAHAIPSQAANVDDVAFVEAMITQISAAQRINPRRIFATGFSNGGIFAHYLGSKLAHRLAAIAPVSGGIAEPVLRAFKPDALLSVCMIHGAADKMVPFDGGNVDVHDNGRVIATEKSASLWTHQAGAFASPTTALLSDTTSKEHHHVKFTRWSAVKSGVDVVLYTIEDGGHVWPTEPGIYPAHSIWHKSHSFDATRAVWDFFKSHPKV